MKKVDKALLDQIEILFDFVDLDKESYLEQKDIILNPNSEQLDVEMSCGIMLAILGSLIKNSKLKKYIDKKALSSLAKDLENASSDDIENEEFYDLIYNFRDDISLLDFIVRSFPFLKDESEYKGKRIYFYKRAQLLTSDV